MDKAAELDLINRAKKGDWAAFRELVEGHHRRVYGLAYRLTGRHAESDAVTQDVFVRAFQGLAQFGGRSSLITWLCGITVRTVINRQRGHKFDDGVLSLADLPAVSRDKRRPAPLDPPETLRRKELLENIAAALGELPSDERCALTLVVMEGVSYREAAQVLGCSQGTVAWRVWSARRRLREMLSSHLE